MIFEQELHLALKSKTVSVGDIRLNRTELVVYNVEEQRKRIAKMVLALQNGQDYEPIIVSEGLAIRDGHTRYLAAKKLGWKSIKVIIIDDEEWNEYITKRDL
jgi:hypothetical protein